MPADMHRRMTLPDGRRLGYAVVGDPAGRPLLYFHGYPGSRLESRLAVGVAERLGARVIAVDRPGYGLSDFKPGRTLADWPADVVALADSLGLDRFAAVGASGGGPSLLACAALIPQRLSAAGIVCGLGPLKPPGNTDGMALFNRFGLALGRVPGAARAILGTCAPLLRRNPDRLVSRLIALLPEPDRSSLASAELRPFLTESFGEAFRQGGRGAAHDLRLYATGWPFDPATIGIEVLAWHGERDTIVPPAMTRYLERTLPRCRATFFPDEGHFSLIQRRLEPIFARLVRGQQP